MLGKNFGHYRIDALLGGGGFGTVYRAYDEVLHRPVALKILKQADATARSRVLREARAASALNHPGIAVVHEVAEQNGVPFIVMEYVEGRPLSDIVPPGRGLDLEQALDYGNQVAEAIAYAHEHGVVHRDLKTANVMVTPAGRIKVLDFGLADAPVDTVVAAQTETAPGDPNRAGHVAGTLRYMAPELLRGQSGDRRSDVWALGVVLHELLSGEHPFVGKTQYELSAAILSSSPRDLPAVVPPQVRIVVGRCLTRDPARRYQQAREIHAAVDAIRAGAVIATPEPWFRRRLLLGATAGLTLGAVLFALSPRACRPAPVLKTLAIVPEVRADTDPELAYLVDGLTESVINRVGRLQSPELRVIALSSVVRYKGRPIDVDQVRRELGVSYVAILRITPRKDGLALGADLEEVAGHTHLWGEQYDTRLASLIEMQDEVAARVSDGLRMTLTGAQRQELTRRETTDDDAYRAYLHGRYYWYRSATTSDGYDKSLSYYQQAITRDPRYSLAYLGIADTYAAMAVDGWIVPSDAALKARSALDRALAIDPTLPESHYSRGAVALLDQDWATNAREMGAAATLVGAPYYRRFYALNLLLTGHFEDALDEMRRALEVDPLGIETNTSYGQSLFWTRRYDEAIKQLNHAVELDPDFADAHELLAAVNAKVRRYDVAIKEVARTARLAGDDAAAADLEARFTKDGFEAAVTHYYRNQLETMSAAAQLGWVSPIHMALLSINAGDRDAAFDWFEKARQERQPWLLYLRADPAVDSVRDDPRFDALVKRVGAPWAR
jgi:TolB-like protein/Tfp pilus assembly protein PilF/predicted Ser/Thr protein kinase